MLYLYLEKTTAFPEITKIIQECLYLDGFDCDVVDFGSTEHSKILDANNGNKQLCSISSSELDSNLFEQSIFFFELPHGV